MQIIPEIIGRLYAQAPAAAVALGLLLTALAVLMLSSAQRLWRPRPTAPAQRSDGPLDGWPVVEWQNAGESADPWPWTGEDRESLAGSDGEFVVGYRLLELLPVFVASLAGLALMSTFARTTLSFLGADFASGVALLLIFAPCIPAAYCGWVAWRSGQRIWRQGRGLAACRINAEFIDVGNRRYAWKAVKGIGREMSSCRGGEKLTTLMLRLADKNVVQLGLSGLNCRPEQVAMQVERFWREQQSAPALDYALALSRIAGFLLPLRTRRVVAWRVSTSVDEHFRALAQVGVIPPTIGAGVEFLVDGQGSGGMIALCTHAGDDPDDDQKPLWLRVDLGCIARTLLARIAQVLATTYARIDGATIETQPIHEVKQLPQAVLATELSIAELSLAELDDAEALADDRFVFWLTLDGALLNMLDREEKRHAGERGDFLTYLEHEVVTVFRRFIEAGDSAA